MVSSVAAAGSTMDDSIVDRTFDHDQDHVRSTMVEPVIDHGLDRGRNDKNLWNEAQQRAGSSASECRVS